MSLAAEPAALSERLLREIRGADVGSISLMEVCGTHTMAIARWGLRQLLPENIRLISGPGCPVCVTPPEMIDAVLALSARPDVTVATYGDMVRVPGSSRGDSLGARRAKGAAVEIVYSPMDALELAQRTPERQVIFLGVGFETTAPGTAAAIASAAQRGIGNFTVLSMLKTVEPALRALIADPEFNIQGFLCPGHVATVIGELGFAFLPAEYGIPAVISGFEPLDILLSVYRLVKQLETGAPAIENTYSRAVRPLGNELAADMLRRVFEPCTSMWRGLGEIPGSGLRIRSEFRDFDAAVRFGLSFKAPTATACRCGEVICGKLTPRECPMFGTACTPEEPVGPCMVSGEGACAAEYKYRGV